MSAHTEHTHVVHSTQRSPVSAAGEGAGARGELRALGLEPWPRRQMSAGAGRAGQARRPERRARGRALWLFPSVKRAAALPPRGGGAGPEFVRWARRPRRGSRSPTAHLCTPRSAPRPLTAVGCQSHLSCHHRPQTPTSPQHSAARFRTGRWRDSTLPGGAPLGQAHTGPRRWEAPSCRRHRRPGDHSGALGPAWAVGRAGHTSWRRGQRGAGSPGEVAETAPGTEKVRHR